MPSSLPLLFLRLVFLSALAAKRLDEGQVTMSIIIIIRHLCGTTTYHFRCPPVLLHTSFLQDAIDTCIMNMALKETTKEAMNEYEQVDTIAKSRERKSGDEPLSLATFSVPVSLCFVFKGLSFPPSG